MGMYSCIHALLYGCKVTVCMHANVHDNMCGVCVVYGERMYAFVRICKNISIL